MYNFDINFSQFLKNSIRNKIIYDKIKVGGFYEKDSKKH